MTVPGRLAIVLGIQNWQKPTVTVKNDKCPPVTRDGPKSEWK